MQHCRIAQEHSSRSVRETLALFRPALLLACLMLVPAAAQHVSSKMPIEPPAVSYNRAQQLFEQHRLSESRAILETLAGTHASAGVYLLLADVAREQKDLAFTMSSLQRAAKLDPQNELAYLEFSEICGDHGNPQLALDTSEIGLANVPNSYRLKIQKGVSLDELGRFEESIAVFEEASAQQPENSLALLSLAVLLTHSSHLDQAERVFATAVQRYPQNANIHYFHGKLLLQLASSSTDGDALRDRAMEEFAQSVRYGPSHADSWYQLSNLYPPDQQDRAEAALTRCLKLDPQHAPAQYALARLYIRKGRTADGKAMLSKYKARQHAAELQDNKQLHIDVAQ